MAVLVVVSFEFAGSVIVVNDANIVVDVFLGHTWRSIVVAVGCTARTRVIRK